MTHSGGTLELVLVVVALYVPALCVVGSLILKVRKGKR